MNNALLSGFLIPLALTEVIELAGARIMGMGYKADYLLVFLTNIVTNLSLNLVIMIGGISYREPVGAAIIILMEVMVVLIEWLIYRKFMKWEYNKLKLSASLNTLSFLGGLIWGII